MKKWMMKWMNQSIAKLWLMNHRGTMEGERERQEMRMRSYPHVFAGGEEELHIFLQFEELLCVFLNARNSCRVDQKEING